MLYIIISGRIRKRKIRKISKYLTKGLNSKSIEHQFVTSLYKGHGIEIARDAVENGANSILVVGGDGSVNDAINGIMTSKSDTDKSKIKIGVIPQGKGNDWGRYWKITKRYKRSINRFLNGETTAVDLGRVTYYRNKEKKEHYFINSVGFGLDCRVVGIVEKLKHYLGSFGLLYFIALLIAIFKHKESKVKAKDDKTTYEENIYTINIANGCYSGGGMKQNPKADPTDGIFDVMIMKKPKLQYITTALTCLFNGTLMLHPAIKSFRTHKVELLGTEYFPFEADGVIVDTFAPVQVDIIPKGIMMVH